MTLPALTPRRQLIAAYVALVASASLMTWAITPAALPGVVLALGLALLGLGAGLVAGRRLDLGALVIPFTAAACVSTLALWSPLGRPGYGAIRHIDMGISIEPAGLWVISAHLAAVGYFKGRTHGIYLAANLAGAFGAALLMPELSLIPQIVAGTVVISWLVGRKKLAAVIVLGAISAVALSSLFPYVQNRWMGFLDPVAHAQHAGYDYQMMAQAVSESQWFAGHDGTLPAMSSPTNDYWLAAGLWRIGRLLMLLWVTFFLGTLWRSKKLSSPSDERGLLMHAILATLATSWLVHAAYNLGFIPVTATYPPLAGLSGSIAASQLFLVGYCLVTRGERPG